MASTFGDLIIINQRYGSYGPEDSQAWALAVCPDCGGNQMATIARSQDGAQEWLRCVNCSLATVRNNGAVSPTVLPLRAPVGVVGVELAAWKEVRECLSVGAYTAAVMMCRKLLFHVAVAQGMPEANDRGRAPSFIDAVEHLQDNGLITARMRPWVDRIKDVGNEANHQIQPINPDVALDVATFTEQLLRLTYEMDALMAGSGGGASSEPTRI